MKKMPKVKTVMTPFPYDIGPGEPVGRARALLLEPKIPHLPVTVDHELVGIISDRDIKLMLGPEFDYPDPREVTVEDVMVDDPYVVDVDTPLAVVLEELAARHIGSALVTKSGRLAGIFSTHDACRTYAEMLRETFPGPPDPTDAA